MQVLNEILASKEVHFGDEELFLNSQCRYADIKYVLIKIKMAEKFLMQFLKLLNFSGLNLYVEKGLSHTGISGGKIGTKRKKVWARVVHC